MGTEVRSPQEVLSFWLEEIDRKQWYVADEALDAAIRDRFGATWTAAMAGQLEGWRCGPANTLAYLIVTDQFSRNMFRGTAAAFATDARALRAATRAVAQGWDQAVEWPVRQFFFMPFSHSEILQDQERAVRLFMLRSTEDPDLTHSRAHRWVIRKFGRFPYRNAALKRRTTARENDFLSAGGYSAAVEAVREAA